MMGLGKVEILVGLVVEGGYKTAGRICACHLWAARIHPQAPRTDFWWGILPPAHRILGQFSAHARTTHNQGSVFGPILPTHLLHPAEDFLSSISPNPLDNHDNTTSPKI